MTNRSSLPFCRWFLCALLGYCAAFPAAATAPEKPKPVATDAAHDQMMAEAMKYASPGPQHAVLKTLEGSWRTTTKAWMGPGDPQVSEGHSTISWVLGGRFLREEYKGNFMGQTFEGLGLTGYDNLKKEYVSTWSDTMSTNIMLSHGIMDPGGKVLTFNATFDDPTTGKPATMKMVNKIVDPNKHVLSMYAMHDGQEQLQMEITYIRQ